MTDIDGQLTENAPPSTVREKPARGPAPSRGRLVATLGVVALLAIMTALTVGSLVQKSATFDEPYYIAGGHIYWTTHDATWANRFHPVFAPLWVSLPTLTMDLLPPDDPAFESVADDVEGFKFFYAYFYANSVRAESVLAVARLATVALAVLLGIAVYAWSAALFGRAGGFLSLILYVFAPNVLAHGRLATTDFAITTFTLLTLYFYWRFVRRRERWALLPTGVCFGLAMLSKFTAVILLPVMLLIALVEILAGPSQRYLKKDVPARGIPWRVGSYALALLVGFGLTLTVLGVGYRFDYETGGRATDIVLAQAEKDAQAADEDSDATAEDSGEEEKAKKRAPLGFAPSLSLKMLRSLPVPPQYVDSVAWAFDKNRDGHPTFLHGKRSDTGWWYYFPVAFAVKTTIPFMILLVIGSIFLLILRPREALFLLLPAAALFGAAMTGRVDIGFRHVLPIMPLLFVASGAMLPRAGSRAFFAALLVVAVALCGWHAWDGLSTYPDYLAHFNRFAGGPDNGWRWLVDSNLDWGQDIRRIGPRLRKLGIDEPVRLCVFGNCGAGELDFPWKPLPYTSKPKAAVWVVSATELQDVYSGDPDRFAWLRDNFTPIDTIGHSIFIYRITKEDIEALPPKPDKDPEPPDEDAPTG